MRAAALLALTMLVLAVPAWGAKRPPTLKLVTIAPLVVQGTGFTPREPVLLTATIGNVRRFAGPIARANGSFTARFKIRITTCTNLVVRAVGGRGSRATLKKNVGCEVKRGPTEGPPRQPGKPPKQRP
jgi:hypothetical protein